MASIAEIRRNYPQYRDLSDKQIADALHAKYYRDVPIGTFYSKVGLSAPATPEDKVRDETIADLRKNEGFFDAAGDYLQKGRYGFEAGMDRVVGTLARSVGADSVADRVLAAARRKEQVAGTEVEGEVPFAAVKRDPFSTDTLKFMAQQGAASLPAMGMAAVSLPMIAASQAGSLAQQRALNNARRDATVGDIVKAAPAAIASSLLERVGIKGITGSVGANVATRVGKATAREAGTEAAQSSIEYAGSNLGTDAGFDPSQMTDQALAGALVGAGVGGTGRGAVEAVRPLVAPTALETEEPFVTGGVEDEVIVPPAPVEPTEAVVPVEAPVAEVPAEPGPQYPVGLDPDKPASWVIRDKETGSAVLETFDPAVVEQVDTEKYEAVPALQHLQEFDAAVKGAGGTQPPPGWNRAMRDETPVPTLVGDGSAKAPIVATTPEHVEAAATRVAEPTDAQKEAGNYTKGHIKLQGLDIAIENPKGSERSGTDANGEAWSVTMPDHYGYVKRTEGADGDAVDVYIGPQPDSDQVFVIDQRDADTGKFDEHKAMLGYTSSDDALTAYHAAFSDGRGGERIDNVMPMSMGEFKDWLKQGDTTAPAAPPNQPPPPPGTAVATIPPDPPPAGGPLLPDTDPKLLAELDRRLGHMFRDAKRFGADNPIAKGLASLAARSTGRQTTLNRNYVEPLLADMERAQAKEGVSPQDLDAYLWARATPARNAMLPDVPDAAGQSDEEAAEVIDDLRAQGKLPTLERLAARHDKLRKDMLQERVRGGLSSADTVAALEASQPFYANLSGWAPTEETGDETPADRAERERRMETNRRKATGVRPREFVAARGRASMPFSPTANLVSEAMQVEARVERNRTVLPFLDAVQSDPDAWGDIVKVYGEGRPLLRPGPDGKLKPVDLAGNAAEFLVIQKDGKPHYLKFQNSEQGETLKRMFDNLQPQQMEGVVKALTGARQFFTSMMTRHNPYYPLRAVLRDTIDAVVTAYSEESMPGGKAEGKKIAARTVRYVTSPTQVKAIGNFLRGKEPANAEQAEATRLLEQMINDGGAVGHAMVMNAEQFAQSAAKRFRSLEVAAGDRTETDIRSALTRATEAKGVVYPKEKVKALLDGMDDLNQAIDLNPRLATYRAALDAGIGREDAAALALSSSLDLTRRGEWSRMADLLYYFFNPRVQSVIKQAKMIKSPNGRKALAAFTAMGFMSGMWNSMLMGGDDDDDGRSNFETIPSYQKYSGLIFAYGPGANDYVWLPVGFVVAFPSFLGQKIADVTFGQTSPEKAATSLTDHMVEMSKGVIANYAPVSANFTAADDLMTSSFPSMVAPIAQSLDNRNFFGTKITNDRDTPGIVKSQQGRESTGEGWKAAARLMNMGDEDYSHWADAYPETLRHYVNGYTGNAMKPAVDVAELGKKIAYGEDVGAKDIPGTNVFAGKGGEWRAMNDYFTAADVMTPIARMRRDGELTAEKRAERPIETSPRVLGAWERAETQRRSLGKRKNAQLERVTDEGQRRALLRKYEKDRNAVYARFLRVYNEARRQD